MTTATVVTSSRAKPKAEPSRRSLLFASEFLDGVEDLRIATENRLRSMAEDLPGVDLSIYESQVEALKAMEAAATKELTRAMKAHALGPWVARSKGVGLKQAARLLAAVGDPYIRPVISDENGIEIEPSRPRRGPAELWQYCGHGDPERSRRRKGETVQFSPTAKMRAHLIAESIVKAGGPYREVYDRAKESWADRDVKDGHRHNHALRITAKAVLRDLFLEAKRLHLADDSHEFAMA